MHSKLIYLIKRIPFSILILPIFLMGSIEIRGIKERRFSHDTSEKIYEITAKKKIINPEALKKLNLINKQNVAMEYIFYLDGEYIDNNVAVRFEKGYFLESDFYFTGYSGKYGNEEVFAKEGKIKDGTIFLYDITYKTDLYTRKGKKLIIK